MVGQMAARCVAILRPLRRVEILVFGHAQVGKTALIAALLDEPTIAPIGDGLEPCTQCFQRRQVDGLELIFCDSKGFEGSGDLPAIRRFVVDQASGGPSPLALLCLSEHEPIQESHRALFSFLVNRMSVIIVLTKAYQLQNTAYAERAAELFAGATVCRVNLFEWRMSDECAAPVHGLDELASELVRAVEHSHHLVVRWSQIYEEAQRTRKFPLRHVEEAAAALGHKVRWNSLPKVDQLPIRSCWEAVIRRSTELFALKVTQQFVDELVGPALEHGRSGASFIKFIPVAGWVVGGLVAGLNARDATFTFGEKYVDALVKCRLRDELVSEQGIRELLNDQW
jgi:uncharacterized protein (DUF697 family)/GTP-binding protein EngB required for normal cell division